MLDKLLYNKLENRKKNDSFRILSPESTLIDFTSNDYLGLARSEDLFRLIHQKAESHQHLNGATGSRLLSGNTKYTEEVEKKLSGIFQSEASLIFNSGYTANLAVLSSIPQKDDTILYDEFAHACIKDGARLSLASRHPFKHNDLDDLETKLKRSKGNIFIAVESVYSMDGDECPLENLCSLAENYKATIILDEAHSTGVVGENGSGVAVSKNLQAKIAIRIYTFGKAMGIHGACVTGSNKLIKYLINFARPFIYTTAMPPHSIAGIDCTFAYLKNNAHLQHAIAEKIDLYTREIENSSEINQTKSNTAIQTIIIPGNKKVKAVANSLQQDGFDVRPILSPTVKEGSERLRICLHAYNTNEEIMSLANSLNHLIKD